MSLPEEGLLNWLLNEVSRSLKVKEVELWTFSLHPGVSLASPFSAGSASSSSSSSASSSDSSSSGSSSEGDEVEQVEEEESFVELLIGGVSLDVPSGLTESMQILDEFFSEDIWKEVLSESLKSRLLVRSRKMQILHR